MRKYYCDIIEHMYTAGRVRKLEISLGLKIKRLARS